MLRRYRSAAVLMSLAVLGACEGDPALDERAEQVAASVAPAPEPFPSAPYSDSALIQLQLRGVQGTWTDHDYRQLIAWAREGEYDAQRALSSILGGQFPKVLERDPIAACAWRYVMERSPVAASDDSPLGVGVVEFCDMRLSPSELAMARAVADTLPGG